MIRHPLSHRQQALLDRGKLAMKRKPAIKVFFFALLFPAVALCAGQAAAANRPAGDSLQKGTKAARRGLRKEG